MKALIKKKRVDQPPLCSRTLRTPSKRPTVIEPSQGSKSMHYYIIVTFELEWSRGKTSYSPFNTPLSWLLGIH